jgi:O-methyltransferase involved in polyketide biosynthesis
MGVSGALGGPTLEAFLMARHIKLDELLRKAIDTGRVGQVVEVAAGLSPRGWRFSSRYGAKIDYVEADLAGMARRKREALGRMDALGPHHRVAELNALEDEGPLSLAALVEELDPDRGLAIVTEGLLPYFPREEVKGMWRRFAEAIGRFPSGVYLSDIHINSIETGTATAVRRALIGAFVRGRVFTNFDDEKDAIAALKRAGFTRAKLHRASDQEGAGARMVRILEAS